MNYEIVKDEKLLKDFIEWLPVLKPEEKYYFCLFARNKYCKELVHIKSDKAQLKRFVTDKERMYDKIKQLEIEVGRYKQREFGVPQEALALYMTPNPRNMFKASVNTMVKLAQSIRDQNFIMNCHQEALSEIQKAKSRTCWIDFDIDCGDRIDIGIRAIYSEINRDAVTFLRTRGGMHALINPDLVHPDKKKTFYRNILALQDTDQAGDNMIPVPGCTQGNFIPHFLTNDYVNSLQPNN